MSATLESALECPPGPDALVRLATIDPAELDDRDAVLLLQAWERQLRWAAAHGQRILARVAGPAPRPGSAEEDWVCEEVAAALDLAPSTGRGGSGWPGRWPVRWQPPRRRWPAGTSRPSTRSRWPRRPRS